MLDEKAKDYKTRWNQEGKKWSHATCYVRARAPKEERLGLGCCRRYGGFLGSRMGRRDAARHAESDGGDEDVLCFMEQRRDLTGASMASGEFGRGRRPSLSARKNRSWSSTATQGRREDRGARIRRGASPSWRETEEHGGGRADLRRENWAAWGRFREGFLGQIIEGIEVFV